MNRSLESGNQDTLVLTGWKSWKEQHGASWCAERPVLARCQQAKRVSVWNLEWETVHTLRRSPLGNVVQKLSIHGNVVQKLSIHALINRSRMKLKALHEP